MHHRAYFSVAGVLCLFALVSYAGASSIAFDTAGDSAYSPLILPPIGTNGGFGWGGGWTFPTANPGQPKTVYSLSLGSSPSGNINSPATPQGRAWSIPGTGAQPINDFAARPFNGALSIGQTFMVDFDLHESLSGSDLVLTGPSQTGWEYNYFVSSNSIGHYIIQVFGGSAVDTGLPISAAGVHIEFTPIDSATAQMSLTSFDPSHASASFLLNNLPVAQMEVYNGARDYPVYFNNIAITPEPLGISLIAAAGAMLLLNRPQLPARS